MAISDSQKVDLLYKKLFGVTKTDLPANKSPSNESIASPSLLRGDNIWQEAANIPTTAAAVTNIVQAYQTTNRIQCTADTTTTPISSVYPSWKTSLTDWIPPEFGSTYFVKVYADTSGASDPTVTGTQLSDSGIAGVGEWNFDYQSGVLNFIGGTIPAALTVSKVIFIVGYRYIGLKGIANLGNVSSGNAYITNFSTGNAVITGGYFTGLANITATTGNVESWYATNINSTNANIATGWFGNLSTANAVISGGYISSLSNITATTGNVESWYATDINSTNGNITTLVTTNFSSSNVLIAGGVIYNVNLQANNFSTANALITGGVLNNIDVQANNFSTANALITGGNVTANISGNVTGSFSSFSGNVNADWFIGNIDGTVANFLDVVYTNSNLTVAGNLIASGNVIARKITSPSGDLHISAATNDPNNIIRFDSVSAFDIPSGTTDQRPPTPDYGYVRYNIDQGSIEWWGGASWVQGTQTVIAENITPDGIADTYTLAQSTTEDAILVNINGTIQQAGAGAYSVIGDQITFAEIPLTTDIIEIRYLAGGVAIANYGNTQVGAYLTTNTGNISAGNLTVAGNVFQQSAYYESFGNISNTGGNLTCNFNAGAVFYVNSLTANVTANFTNVNAVTGTVTGATVIVNQGATAYQISNVQVNGAMQTVRWSGATVPIGTASNTDVMSFSLINLGAGGWKVLGQFSNYG